MIPSNPLVLVLILRQGLDLIVNATLNKGPEWLKEHTGFDTSRAQEINHEILCKLKQFELENEEELLELQKQNDQLEKLL